MTERSLIILAMTVIMGWLILDQRLDIWSALWVAWMIVVLIVLAAFLVLAELFNDPGDIAVAWAGAKRRLKVRLRKLRSKIRR